MTDTTRPRSGFTIQEMLVVIAIIGVLVGLLLPAVQAARERARQASCHNTIRQLALGSQEHVRSQGFFPSGGWGYLWTGDADRGFGRTQPGGWAYSTLPFIDQISLHQVGAGLGVDTSGTGKMQANKSRCETPVTFFYCASRRQANAFPNSTSSPRNANTVSVYAKTDYAYNAGRYLGPGSNIDANCLTNYPNCTITTTNTSTNTTTVATPSPDDWFGSVNKDTGLTSYRSETKPAHVRDGLSNTVMLGEKYVTPENYTNGMDPADNMDAWEGYDWDTVRWATGTSGAVTVPTMDKRGTPNIEGFGSAHPYAMISAAADGSIRAIAYAIDPTVWLNLCVRNDGQVVSWEAN